MTTFFLGCSDRALTDKTLTSTASSVYNSSDEFQDAERAWDPAEHLVSVVRRNPATPVLSRNSSFFEVAVSPQRAQVPPRHISLPENRMPSNTMSNNTVMNHGLPTCDDETKEFDFGKPVQKNLPKAPLDFLMRPPSPPYVSVPVNSPNGVLDKKCVPSFEPEALNSAFGASEGLKSSFEAPKGLNSVALTSSARNSGVLASFEAPSAPNTLGPSSFVSDSSMGAFLDDEDYPASGEEESEDEFFVDSDTIKAAHESVLDLKSLLENNFSLVPGESVESLEKRALRMVHLEESFSVQDSFEPRTLLQDQDRAFIPWIPVIEDLNLYFEMRYPHMLKGTSRYEFHRARLVRNRTRLRILAQYVAQLEHRSRDLCRLSRSF